MKNNPLKYFIIGLSIGFILLPLIEELMNVVNTWIQVLIIKPSKIVLKGNKELSELQDDEIPQETFCMGFRAPSDSEYYEDDEYY